MRVMGMVLVLAAVASADLIEVDLFVAGDGLITRDTDTNLDWLDLTETTSLSYTDIVNNVGGWSALGFVHATNEQIRVMFSHSAVGATPNPFQGSPTAGANFTGADNLLDLMGQTGFIGGPFGEGWSATTNGPFYRTFSDGTGELVYIDGGGAGSVDVRSSQIGNWLIKSSPVPEPGTYALFGMALVGYGIYRRRRRRG